MAKTIFITGASRGFGKLWTEALLKRGDKVAATSRNIESYKDLAEQYPETFLPISLDITDREAVFEAVNKAKNHFGSLDVVINNAGYGVFGAVEEVGEKAIKDVFEANVFGTLWVTQAALPIFRAQGSGHVIQLSSVLGVWSLPTLGIYNATKFAVEGFSEALATEVKAFGINVTMIEPNGYTTDFGGSSAVHGDAIPAYDALKASLGEAEGLLPEDYGTPDATVPAILKLIDSENPPLRLFLGKVGLRKTERVYAEKLKVWNDWKEVSEAAHGH
ncbi:NADP-dependent 3-hydroxy acid dehydrogenase YdfG [Chitinophaga terrae (ex Kim and Jung 2007)]|uniref:NADP-dependent 3-hydroxy acid dehydrogenase YdfG n=1 Tax=Chitinophaga terrae (ex Kim and Jung 2007) TaxID=408074 RepID=A0A1H4G3R9_9BACT|nr:SDR family NAD(P)-dependent oxidoreductase [Chitinophaga terrae (ex Kim and Jung 2007)]GEP93044.1 short-chain dehydrogenase/reductase [Chitinophaga terrae (ex Kim and Jung 2007)]SEB03578.1 NADP-dependent 3-hydroxy acid dehydrogenase YdfG [Chitinophaga terrae (ex Kim and Jung 2007)]